ncbi:phosphatase PAP2 family protein [Bifidobacterium oedipodis]|uniref:Membrane-associated phospholipid phosphatase n=1 Tax=Bifidobacterium oedipodis TaxID=2675322 RepID=A0A7Y0ER90_9BIFI|nr:phosphatase PAP2 family protein [Bifidobacterium sp. DSM 109957]NMM94979.1 Membrane-associated phospholipid phosphatase [Bifidobacterium sp. DSM 109957]
MSDVHNPIIRDSRKPANMVDALGSAPTSPSVGMPRAGAVNAGAGHADGSRAGAAYAGESYADTPRIDALRNLRADNQQDPLAALGPDRNTPTGLSASSIDRSITRVDPLIARPRISSSILCVLFGLLLIAAAFGVWYGCVFTESGQSYDELIWKQLPDRAPAWSMGLMGAVAHSWLVIAVSCVLAIIGIVIAALRRRWWLLGQMAVFAVLCLTATRLKGLLPRPFIINTESPAANSAPSGHTILAAAAVVVLVLGVPRAARALASVVAVAWSLTVGVSVMVGQWHRTGDVAMSLLLVAGIALLTLTFTRASGMDEPGRRVSSVSIQIVGTVLITGGLLLLAYSAYVIWQVAPGLTISASWSVEGAIISSIVGLSGLAALTQGLILTFRQLTASPLSRLGLIGAPPAPPRR